MSATPAARSAPSPPAQGAAGLRPSPSARSPPTRRPRPPTNRTNSDLGGALTCRVLPRLAPTPLPSPPVWSRPHHLLPGPRSPPPRGGPARAPAGTVGAEEGARDSGEGAAGWPSPRAAGSPPESRGSRRAPAAPGRGPGSALQGRCLWCFDSSVISAVENRMVWFSLRVGAQPRRAGA